MKLLINVSSFRVYFLQISLIHSETVYFCIFQANNHSYSKNDVTIPKILLILEDHELERYTDM